MIPETLNRIASNFEGLATNPDIWLRQAFIEDLAKAFREMEDIGIGPQPRSLSFVTPAIASGDEIAGEVEIAKSFIINRVTSDSDVRIRLYATNDFRIADGGRPVGVDPTGEHGLLLELVLIPIFLDFSLAPPAVGYNGDDPQSSAIYYAIQNNGASGPVNLTIYYTELVP